MKASSSRTRSKMEMVNNANSDWEIKREYNTKFKGINDDRGKPLYV